MILKNYLNITGEPGKIPALDGLRALAITLVVLRHFQKTITEHYNFSSDNFLIDKLTNVFSNGWLGVDLFFVLSGYLITISLIKKNYSSLNVPKFYLKRVLRTFPVYFVFIFLIFYNLIPAYIPHAPISKDELIKHFFFMQDYKGTSILITMWSLAVEEKFYLISPFLIFFLSKAYNKKKFLIIWLALISIPLASKVLGIVLYKPETYTQYFWLIRAPLFNSIDAILIGVLVAFLSQNKQLLTAAQSVFSKGSLIAWVLLSIILIASDYIDSKQWLLTMLMTLTCTVLFGFIVFIYVSVNNVMTSTYILKNRLLLFFSKISYSLYLAHFTVINLALIISDSIFSSTNMRIFAFFIIYWVFSIVFAVIIHLLVEKPFLLIKDKIL